MLVFIFGWEYFDSFDDRRKIKCLLHSGIITADNNYLFKLIFISVEAI